MIQRIQSIYLLLASGALWAQFGVPYAMAPEGSTARTVKQFSDGVLNPMDNVGLLGLTILGGVICLFAIFLYRKNQLKTQVRLASLGMLVNVFLLALVFIVGRASMGAIPAGGKVSYGLGVALPAIALLLTFLASRSIRKDDTKYRSADRLR